MAMPVNSMNMGPSPYFFCSEVSSLIRSNVVWNTMMANKPFYKSKVITWEEALHAGKTNPCPVCLFQ